jgi:hypothetical protein
VRSSFKPMIRAKLLASSTRTRISGREWSSDEEVHGRRQRSADNRRLLSGLRFRAVPVCLVGVWAVHCGGEGALKVRRVIFTAYAMALATMTGVLLVPTWIPFVAFGYFAPVYGFQLLILWPSLVQMVYFLLSIGVTPGDIVFSIGFWGFLYYSMARLWRRWLLLHYPWFRSVR